MFAEIVKQKSRSTGPEGYRVTFVVFATKATKQLCGLLASAILADFNIVVIGWNCSYAPENVVRHISSEYARYLCSNHIDMKLQSLILGADGYDTIFLPLASNQEIIRKFSRTGADFVWSAERNLFPDYTVLPSWLKDKYPNITNSPFKYLNFGGWVGTLEACCATLSDVAAIIDDCGPFCAHSGSSFARHDQHAAHIALGGKQWMSSKRFKVVLDDKNSIFHPAWPDCKDFVTLPGNNVRLMNGQMPLMLHLNGDSKFACPEKILHTGMILSRHSHTNIKIHLFNDSRVDSLEFGDVCKEFL